MRRTNTILSILLSFLIFITVFQQFNINYETMLELNYSAAIDKNTNDTFVIKSVLNVENLDNSTKEKLMDFSSKHDATINITYAGPPYIKGKESLTYLTFGPQANEIYNKIFTENNEFFDLNNVLETKVLTNIASDTPIYPNRVQIDSIASQSNLISRNHVTFIGSFYYFEQIIEELEQNYLTVGIQVEKESYSYL